MQEQHRIDTLDDLIALPVTQDAGTAQTQIETVVGLLAELWVEASKSVRHAEPTQQDNLKQLQARIERDIGTMRDLLGAPAVTPRRTVYALVCEPSVAAAAANEALGVCTGLCAAIKPYTLQATQNLFEALRAALQKLSLQSGFGDSVADLESLFAAPTLDAMSTVAAPYRDANPLQALVQTQMRTQSQTQIRAQPQTPMQTQAEPEDDLDQLLRQYSQRILLARQTRAGLGASTDGGHAVSRASTEARDDGAPGSAPGPAQSELAGAALPASVEVAVRAALAAQQGDGTVDAIHARPRAHSTPAAHSPTKAPHRNKPTPDSPRLPWPASARSGHASPRTADKSPRSTTTSTRKPSRSAAPTREVVGYAAAQMQWFLGTPGEFNELYNDNLGLQKFLALPLFANMAWRADLLAQALDLRRHVERIDESFLISTNAALKATTQARKLALALEGQFADLCAGPLGNVEQVVLFAARNLNWSCHKILGRAYQALVVREKVQPLAMESPSRGNAHVMSATSTSSTSSTSSATSTASGASGTPGASLKSLKSLKSLTSEAFATPATLITKAAARTTAAMAATTTPPAVFPAQGTGSASQPTFRIPLPIVARPETRSKRASVQGLFDAQAPALRPRAASEPVNVRAKMPLTRSQRTVLPGARTRAPTLPPTDEQDALLVTDTTQRNEQ